MTIMTFSKAESERNSCLRGGTDVSVLSSVDGFLDLVAAAVSVFCNEITVLLSSPLILYRRRMRSS